MAKKATTANELSLLAEHDIDAAIAVLEVSAALKQQLDKCVRCNLNVQQQRDANKQQTDMAIGILREFGGARGQAKLTELGFNG